jgi:hypothetical protein
LWLVGICGPFHGGPKSVHKYAWSWNWRLIFVVLGHRCLPFLQYFTESELSVGPKNWWNWQGAPPNINIIPNSLISLYLCAHLWVRKLTQIERGLGWRWYQQPHYLPYLVTCVWRVLVHNLYKYMLFVVCCLAIWVNLFSIFLTSKPKPLFTINLPLVQASI